MSKPFVVKEVVSPQVTVRTLDSASSVVIGAPGVALATSGAGRRIEVSATTGADVHIATDAAGGSGILIEIPGQQAIQLFTDGNIYIFNPGGNILTTADHIFDNANNVELVGSGIVQQTMLTPTASAVLLAAAVNYNQLSNVDVPNIRLSSRLNVEPNAVGTTIRSLFAESPGANPPRLIWIQNIGTAVGQVLTLSNQDPAGTAGGRFFGPGDYVLKAGGGVGILFDATVTANGAWLVHGIAIPAASLTQVFRYVVTGLEPDLSQIAIALPVAMPDALYDVVPSCQGVIHIAAFDVASITNVGFTLITSGALQAGDVISFVATRLT